MMPYRLLADYAHASLLSAGHVVSAGLRRALDRRASHISGSVLSFSDQTQDAVADILETAGFKPDRSKGSIYDLLPDVSNEPRSRPNAGHVVRLLEPWSVLNAGDTLVLSGSRLWGADGWTIAQGRHFWRGQDDEGVGQTSGGPASMLKLDKSVLRATADAFPVSFWTWRAGQEAHGGIDYRRQMPVWEWLPSEGDFLDETRKEERIPA